MVTNPTEAPNGSVSKRDSSKVPYAHILWCSIGLTILAGLIFPLHFSKKYKADISITATGVKDDNVKGVEVWVSETLGPGIVPGASSAGWERRENLQVSYHTQPATLSWSGDIEPEYQLYFVRHPQSGRMILDVNGHKGEYVLYSDEDQPPLIIRPYDLMSDPKTTYMAQPIYNGSLLSTIITLSVLFIFIHVLLLWIIRRRRI